MEYHFADLSLNCDRQVLQRAGQIVKIRPKVFDALVYLIEHRDRLVPKDELMHTLWPDRIVAETTLTTCLKELRQAIGDSGRQQRLVQTQHGRGYRFIADIASAEDVLPEKIVSEIREAQLSVSPAESALSKASTATQTLPSSENKIVSVLNCGIHQAPFILQQLGPEGMDRYMQAFFAVVQEIVEHFEGYITQWLDAGFVALFGAPRAHEDHARRAVLAALDILHRRPNLAHMNVNLGAGVSSGSVVISPLLNDPQRFYTALGGTTHAAAELQRRAGENVLLIGAATYELVSAAVQAVPRDEITFQVRQALPSHAGVPLRSRQVLTPLVGRGQELALLEERLRHAQDGQGQVVALIGEPGIGKSRLLYEFQRHKNDRKHWLQTEFYLAHCVAHGQSTPYLPLLELLQQLAGLEDDDTPAIMIRKLRSLLERSRAETTYGLPLLLHLFDIPYDAVPLSRLSPQARREHTLRLLRNLVIAAPQPRIIVLEDLHWIDATSQEWLTNLLSPLGNAPVLLLLTYRPEYRPPWQTHAHATQLVLPRLTQQDSLALVQSLPQASVIQSRWSDIIARGSGNPYFLEELVWNTRIRNSAIPDTLQGVLAARIDALPARDKQILQTAAVIGIRVPTALLQAVLQAGSHGTAEEVSASLIRLQNLELLFEDYTTPQMDYVFKHILAQEVAYQSLLGNQRRTMHERIATELPRLLGDSLAARPEIMAHHCTEAGLYQRAADYWQQAGRHAYERSAYSETIDYAQKGLQVLTKLAPGIERDQLELRLQNTLGPALMAAKGYGAHEVEQAWARARALCEQLGDVTALFKASIGLSNYYWVRGYFGQAYATNCHLIKLARNAGKPAALLRAHAAMGELLVHAGRLRAAHYHIERGVRAFFAHDRQSFATQTPAVACLCYSAWAWWQRGYDQHALERAEQALALAQDLGQPFSLAVAQSLIAELHQFRLDVPKTLQLATAGAELAREQRFPFWEATARVLQGWAEAQSGQAGQGIARVQYGLELFRTTQAEVQLSSWFGLLAESHACAGQTEAGLTAVSEALRWAEKTDERYYEAELYRLRGGLLIQQGESKSAETALQQAIQRAGCRDARFWQLRAACDLAALWLEQGRSKAALALLQPLYECFDEGFDAPDLRRAKELLDALTDYEAPPP